MSCTFSAPLSSACKIATSSASRSLLIVPHSADGRDRDDPVVAVLVLEYCFQPLLISFLDGEQARPALFPGLGEVGLDALRVFERAVLCFQVGNAVVQDYTGIRLFRPRFLIEDLHHGVREDYRYGTEQLPNVDLPVVVLDNDFRDPDVKRYLDRFDTYDPAVAILGDAYSSYQADQFDVIADQLGEEYPHKELIVVPKCPGAFEQLDEDVTLGFSQGYSDVDPWTYSERSDWRGRNVHILGANPHKQYAVIQELTQPTITDDPPANIVGTDWNGPHKGALMGEYWTPDGWKPAHHLTIRDTVQRSLREIKVFWQDRGVWPETEPIDLYGPAVEEPDEHLYMDRGGDLIPDRAALEEAYVGEYEEKGTVAFAEERGKRFTEYREGWTPV